ncbi:MAG: hypothetical protein IPN76_12975 [Saprospiraceae bacterium]|nr:hypothetical protein [Saprospiraceae bacterium]
MAFWRPPTPPARILWVKPANLTGIKILFEQGGSTAGMACRLNGSNLSAAYRVIGTQYTTGTLSFPNDGAWHHIAVVFNNGTLTCYLDGVASTPATSANTSITANSNNDAIGARNGTDAFGSGSNNFYSGKMDDMRLIYSALAAAKITDLARNDGDRNDLTQGIYTVTVVTATGCSASQNININPCTEICDDGIDNDGDGLTDCADTDCQPVASAGSGTSICAGSSATLTAVAIGGAAPYTFNWSNGLGSGASKTVSPIATTAYTITVTAASGCTSSTSVTVTVTPCGENCTDGIDNDGDGFTDCADPDCAVSSAPVLVNDAYTTCPGVAVQGIVTMNDGNLQSPVITVQTPPTKGTVVLNNFGAFTYTPSGNSCGSDQFTYRVCNASGCCATAVTTIAIGDNTPPTLLNVPADLTISCDDEVPLPPLVTGQDYCPFITINFDETTDQAATGTCGNFTITRTWTTSDVCGNTASDSQVISVEDNTKPELFRLYTLANGKKMAAGVAERTSHLWKYVKFPVPFAAAPLVFAQVASNEDTTAVAVQVRYVTNAGFQVRLAEEEIADRQHLGERISWMAIEAGSLGGSTQLQAGLLNAVNHNVQTLNFPAVFAAKPAFFAFPQTTNEADPASIRTSAGNETGISLWLQEEQSGDAETNHLNEKTAWLALDSNGNLYDTDGSFIGENGSVVVNHEWVTVNLSHLYTKPVVILGSLPSGEANAATIRVRNVTANSFEVRVQEWGYLDGNRIPEKLDYFVVEGSIPNSNEFFCGESKDLLHPGINLFLHDNCDGQVLLDYEVSEFFLPNGRLTIRTWISGDACSNTFELQRSDTCSMAAVRLKAALNGAYIGVYNGENLMRDDLRTKQFIPMKEPYSSLSGFVHKGLGGGEEASNSMFSQTGAGAVVDWVFVECRAANDDSKVLSTTSALLRRDGTVTTTTGGEVIYFWDLPAGDYYVSVRHRNHIGLMTDFLWELDSENPPLINLVSPDTPVRGGRPSGRVLSDRRTMWSGDFNGDAKVIYQGPYNDVFFLFSKVLSEPDNPEFLANFIAQGYYRPDFNLDGKSIYQGPGNDRSMLLINSILAHVSNQSLLANFIVLERLP